MFMCACIPWCSMLWREKIVWYALWVSNVWLCSCVCVRDRGIFLASSILCIYTCFACTYMFCVSTHVLRVYACFASLHIFACTYMFCIYVHVPWALIHMCHEHSYTCAMSTHTHVPWALIYMCHEHSIHMCHEHSYTCAMSTHTHVPWALIHMCHEHSYTCAMSTHTHVPWALIHMCHEHSYTCAMSTHTHVPWALIHMCHGRSPSCAARKLWKLRFGCGLLPQVALQNAHSQVKSNVVCMNGSYSQLVHTYTHTHIHTLLLLSRVAVCSVIHTFAYICMNIQVWPYVVWCIYWYEHASITVCSVMHTFVWTFKYGLVYCDPYICEIGK
jgi:hypothetical protein